MTSPVITREALLAEAKRVAALPGIRNTEAVVIAYSNLSGEPLDPWDLDEAAIIHLAARLFIEGYAVAAAIAGAKAQCPKWNFGEVVA